MCNAWRPLLDVSTVGGRVGPKVNKFEQISSDDHQLLLAGGKYLQEIHGVGRYVQTGGSPDHVAFPMINVMLPTLTLEQNDRSLWNQLPLRVVMITTTDHS